MPLGTTKVAILLLFTTANAESRLCLLFDIVKTSPTSAAIPSALSAFRHKKDPPQRRKDAEMTTQAAKGARHRWQCCALRAQNPSAKRAPPPGTNSLSLRLCAFAVNLTSATAPTGRTRTNNSLLFPVFVQARSDGIARKPYGMRFRHTASAAVFFGIPVKFPNGREFAKRHRKTVTRKAVPERYRLRELFAQRRAGGEKAAVGDDRRKIEALLHHLEPVVRRRAPDAGIDACRARGL